jgi:hypothetical protein
VTDRLEQHDDIIEVFTDYRSGLRTMKTATAEMVKMGFTVDVAQAMLKAMKKENIIDIRGYSKQPPHLLKAARVLREKRFGCRQPPSGVETDNK